MTGRETVKHVNSFAQRSHTCGELRKSHAGQKVKLCGWVQFRRLDKFLVLRDAYGTTQLVAPAEVRGALPCVRKRKWLALLFAFFLCIVICFGEKTDVLKYLCLPIKSFCCCVTCVFR